MTDYVLDDTDRAYLAALDAMTPEQRVEQHMAQRHIIEERYADLFAFESRLNGERDALATREQAIAGRERAVAGVPEPLPEDVEAWRQELDARWARLIRREASAEYVLSKEKEAQITSEQNRLNDWETDLYSRERLYDGHQQRLLAEQQMVRIKEKLLGMTTSEEE